MERKLSCHNDYGILRSAFIKRPEDAFISQSFLNNQWKDLQFLNIPDFHKAIEEYNNFEQILLNNSIELSYFSKNDRLSIDSIYCRDASIPTDFGIVLCNMGKKNRKTEPQACLSDYNSREIKILGQITSPGTIEGGDVSWLDSSTLAVGHGYRTNDEGFRQLTEILQPYGITTIQVDLPHNRGKNDVFHLMSIFSPVDKDLAVVYSPLMSVRFRNELLNRSYTLIEVPDEEYDSMACNVLTIAPRKCIMVRGNPETKKRLEALGCEVCEYSGEEISIKGGGGPTCLTRPLRREVI